MADTYALDTAGPSSTEAELAQEVKLAEEKFQQGIQAIKANDFDQAVELFGQVLQTRCQQFGDVDIKCASTYFRYGAALFYKAQDEQDVFGSTLQAATAHEDAEAVEEESSEDEKENVDDKGKKPMREEELPQAQDAEEVEEGDDSPGNQTDMELAWENLEVAKLIYERENAASYAKELADIHSLLADIGMEQENFESAMQDHKRALELLSTILQADDRRLAELHYKMCLTLQYLDQPEDSLKEIKIAVKLVETRIDNIKAAPGAVQQTQPISAAASAADASASASAATQGGDAAAFAAASTSASEASKQERADLESVLEDMYEKVEELQQVLKEHISTKNALKAAFSHVAGRFGAPQLGQGSSSAGAGPSTAPASSAVVDLGVVGRGTKRVTPMPLPSNAAGPSVLPAPVAATQKRSLEELISGGATSGFGSNTGGTTSKGFASSGTASPGFGATALRPSNSPWPPALTAAAAAKRQKTELTEESNGMASEQAGVNNPGVPNKLPAFLQPANVAAAYGSTSSSKAAD
ncbi:hypothetical protein WJX77_011361 [Trebouxia sp. C0004]